MRCFGRTKKGARCKNNAKFVLCKTHSYQWLIIFTLTAFVGGYIQDVIIPSKQLYDNIYEDKEESNVIFQPIFPANDTSSFNVLIVRFEDYIAKKDTECIGRSIEEHLNVLKSNEELSLNLRPKYVDSVPPPLNISQAKQIQARHNADLIIYGLAANIERNCSNLDICFRFSVSEEVISNLSPAINPKKGQHKIDYLSVSPINVQQNGISIDAIAMKHWINALINVKANNKEEAFLELDKIANDTTLSKNERGYRYISISWIYQILKQYKKSLEAYDKALSLVPKGKKASSFFGNIHKTDNGFIMSFYTDKMFLETNFRNHYNLKNYKKAIENVNELIKLHPNLPEQYIWRANAFKKIKNYENAIRDYKEAIKLDSTNSNYYKWLGNLFYDIKTPNKSVYYYEKSLSLNPQDSILYKFIAFDHAILENYSKALDYFYKAIKYDPYDSLLFLNRGQCFANLGCWIMAEYDLSRAAILDNDLIPELRSKNIIFIFEDSDYDKSKYPRSFFIGNYKEEIALCEKLSTWRKED